MNRTMISLAVLLSLSLLPTASQAESKDEAAKQTAALGKAVGTQLYYVRYGRDSDAAARQQLAGLGGEVREHFDRVATYLVALPAEAAQQLAGRGPTSTIAAIEPVPEYRMLEQVVPWNVDQFQARTVWDQNRDGVIDGGAPDLDRVKVCVIDSGIHRSHSDFAGLAITGEGEGSVGDWFYDGSGHGTHVSGTINAANNQRGVVGVLPGTAALHMVKVFNNSGSWGGGSLASAILKCRNAGADIINMSLGSESFSSTEAAILQDLYDNDGIAIVAAAGNDGNSVRSYPASYPTVISVAAIDNELEQAADFSQTPPSSFDPANPPANSEWDTVELAGGGVQVLSTVPRPNGDVPTYMAKVGNEAYYGGRVTGHTDPAQGEYMPEGDVTGVLVDGGLCLSGSGDASWDGAIVACQRGNGTFADKVNAVRARSGRAVVIYNNIPGDLSATCASNCTQPSIPAVSLSLSKGQALLAAAGQPARVVIDDGSGCTNCDGGYDFMSGTSMASPGVTGALALLWNACGGPQQLPNKTLRLLARESAKDLAGVQPGQNIVYGAGPDRVTGWGMPQVSDAMELGPAYGANCALNLSVTPASMEVCTQQTASVDFTASLGDRFQGSATLSVAGAPQGAQGGFSINPIVHPQKHSTYTLANLDQAAAGLYPLDFSVQDDAAPNIASMAAANLTVRHAAPSAPSTTSPGAGAIGVSPIATLQWQAAADASIYDVTVATDAQFNDIVFTAQTTATQVTTSLLLPSTTYFWRVRADNGCGNGPVSIAASFMTGTTTQQTQCFTSAVAIPDGTAAGVTTQIVVPAMSGTIVDLNLRLEATHGWTGDLVARLTRVGGTTATVLDRPGYPVAGYGCSANNPALTLDDEGNAGSAESQCASGTNSTAYDPNARYTPSMPLSAFDGSAFAGTWTLNVSDLVLGDAGALTRWCLDATTASSSNGNVPPSFDAAEYHFTVNEGDPVGTVVGTVVAHDADDAALQFDIVEGNADGAFMLDAVSGVLTVASVTHAPTVDVVHTMVVRVRDGRGGESRVDVEVRVLAADGVIMADGFE